MGKDVFKARKTCEYILDEITLALRKLKSAKNWGIFDVSGLNSFFELVKEKKIKEANEHILHVRYALENLRIDLYGVEIEKKIHLEFPFEFPFDKTIILSFEKEKEVIFQVDRDEIEDTIRGLGEVKLNVVRIYNDIMIAR